MKKGLMILIAVLALFLTKPVDAHSINTGDHFKSKRCIERTSVVHVNNINKAYVSQKVWAVANTGLNVVSRNIGGVKIETGDAYVNTRLDFKGNTNHTWVNSF